MTTRRAETGSTLTPYHQPRMARPEHFAYLTKRERIEQHEVCHGRKRQRQYTQPRVTERQWSLAQDGSAAVDRAVWRTQKIHGAEGVPERGLKPGANGRTNDHSGKQNGELTYVRVSGVGVGYLTTRTDRDYHQITLVGLSQSACVWKREDGYTPCEKPDGVTPTEASPPLKVEKAKVRMKG